MSFFVVEGKKACAVGSESIGEGQRERGRAEREGEIES